MTSTLLALVMLATHPFSARDMQSMDRLGEQSVSPDGRDVVFSVTSTDVDANKRSSSLWRVRADGGEVMRLTNAGTAKDNGPQWSPDGKTIWFLSTRSGSWQVWKISLGGGEATRVTDEPLDVSNLHVSPDGTRIAYSMDAFPDCADAACTKKRLDEIAAKKSTGQVYDGLFVRHWDTWSNGTRSHLFTRAVAGGASVDVMKGMDADAPSKPFGGAEEFTFTPDSKSLVFTARDVGREEAWSTNFDLYVVPVDGSAKPVSLTADNPATDTQPIFSPDGKTLAYLAMKRPGFESDRQRIMLKPWPHGAARALTEAWDRSVSDFSWNHDGRSLLVTADHEGHKALFKVDATLGKAGALTKSGTARGPLPAGEKFDRVVFGFDTMKAPVELVSMRLDGSDRRTLTKFNDARVADATNADTEEMTFAGANGDTVHAWIIKPAPFDARQKYPIALVIHGGPQGSWHDDFHYRWNPQIFAAGGYAVVMIDPHGSTGYGQSFTDAIRDDWGGAPFVDLQKGLAAATAKYPWMDADNACALGGSYGGFMVDWIAGNWPDRFKCLVSHDGNLDERSAYFATEELWFPEWEHKGTPWDNPAGYSKHNAMDHVTKWKTPMLFIHGGNDFRVVMTEGLAGFTAAQRRGVASKFLYFPDENHWVLKPQNSIQWYSEVLAWMDQYTKKK